MRKIFAITMAAAALGSCSTGMKYTVTGHDEAFADGKYAYIRIEEDNQLKALDSVLIAGNSFKLKGEVETPVAAYVTVSDAGAQRPEIYAAVYLEKGNIEIKQLDPDRRSFNAVGTPLNDANAEFYGKMMELSAAMREAYKAEDTAKAEQIEQQMNDTLKQTIEANAGNVIGPDLFRQNYYQFEPQEVLDIIASFPAEAQNNLGKIKQSAEAALKVMPGNPYVDVTDKDADGKEISLKSVVENKANKYVLLDFWASWCGPCMGELPYLKATYDKYHKKGFEIYGVSFDKDRDAWLKAVKDNDMGWVHVSSLNAWDNQARNDYSINSIPANFLIDCATGKIIAKGLRGEEVQKKIAELLD